jgi:uncharacterized protein YycO
MKLLFTRRRHLGSWIIRFVTWSEYSHVDLLIDNQSLVGAIAFDGVVLSNVEARLSKASKAVLMDIPVKDIELSKEFAVNQLGKKYDWLGVIGIGLKRNWQEDGKWSCAELVAKILAEGGQKPFDSKYHHRITPQHLLSLNFEKVKVK